MRFRSRVSREGISLLIASFTAMSTVNHMGLLFFDETVFRVSVLSSLLENPRGYLEICASEFFSEYRVEPCANNAIACEISLTLLLQALNSGKNATQALIKLSKTTTQPFGNGLSSCPCLSIVLDAADQLLNVDVVHEIPIRLLKVSNLFSIFSAANVGNYVSSRTYV